MQYSKWEYQNIALAAIVQCAALVESLATKGSADDESMRACIEPLLNFNPGNVSELYPNISHFSLGLQTSREIFSQDKKERTAEIIRYVLGILALRQKLMSDKAMQDRVHDALDKLTLPEESSNPEEINQFYQDLAGVYQQTISTYSFRIHVKGNMEFLKDEIVANKIRALLLAAIRSAVLWYQIGGKRWHLILYRKKIAQTSSQIRKSLIHSV